MIREIRTVVLVDDVRDLRDLLTIALEMNADFEVIGEATNGADAIQMIRDYQPDLILLDISMPILGGLEALPAIREVAPDAKIVVLSGFAYARFEPLALAKGADAYLEKGISPVAMLKRLKTIMGS